MPASPGSAAKNVVLVHGGFVDGSGWEAVYRALRKEGLTVSVVQNPTISLAEDVKATRRVAAAHDGRVVLVGHSYGGAVITEAGNDPKVASLVYIAAFVPDNGESVSALIKDPPPGAPVPPILTPPARSCSPAPAPAGRLSPTGQGQVPRLLRRRRGPGARGIHGGRAGPLGGQGAQWDKQRSGPEGAAAV